MYKKEGRFHFAAVLLLVVIVSVRAQDNPLRSIVPDSLTTRSSDTDSLHDVQHGARENSSVPAAAGVKDSDEADAIEAQEKEAMEIGGLVTVDAEGDPHDRSAASLRVGQVALSANVNVAEGVTASITVLSEGNMSELSIDQAVVEVAPDDKPVVLLFGQQLFNFGLLSTRLISDPAILDLVSTSGPGIAVNVSHGNITPGIGLTYFHTDAENSTEYHINFDDSTVSTEEKVVKEASDIFTGVVNCDISLPNESNVRIAARFSGDILDMTAGGGISVGPVLIDAEVYREMLKDDESKAGGYYAGALFTINDRLQAAVRYDGSTENSFDEITHRLGLGTTVSFNHGIFWACEYALDNLGTGSLEQMVALQVGLESTLKLPGFQRKTLTRK